VAAIPAASETTLEVFLLMSADEIDDGAGDCALIRSKGMEPG